MDAVCVINVVVHLFIRDITCETVRTIEPARIRSMIRREQAQRFDKTEFYRFRRPLLIKHDDA